MIGKTKILTSLAAVAVAGSAAVPFVASAQQSPPPQAPAVVAHDGRHAGALAEALGVTPEALAEAMKAARAAAPKPDPGQRQDEAARAAQREAFEAALAQNLGVTVAQLQAALQSVAPAAGEHRGPKGPGGLHGPGGHRPGRAGGNAALAEALGIDVETLTAAQKAVREALPKPAFTPGTRPDREAMEAQKQQHQEALARELGISVDALKAAQEKVRADFEAQRATQAQAMFEQRLARAVADGKITQARADELKAQLAQGGDAARAAMRALHEEAGGPDHGPRRHGPGGVSSSRGPTA